MAHHMAFFYLVHRSLNIIIVFIRKEACSEPIHFPKKQKVLSSHANK